MGKKEFLEILGERLAEELPRNLVISNLQYYENYIEGEVRSGRKLQDVMEELGDPVMIAHTIINTETGESFQGYAEEGEFVEIPPEEEPVYEQSAAYEEKEVEYTHLHTQSEEEYASGEQQNEQTGNQKLKVFSSRLGGFAAILIVLLILGAVLMLLGGIIGALLPILLPVILILIVVNLVKKNR